MVALMPAIQAEFDLTGTEPAYPYVATMLDLLIGNPPLRRFGDRAGIAPVLIAASVIDSLGYIAAGTAACPGIPIVAQVAIGIGTAAALGPLTADKSHWFVRRRGPAVAMVSGSTYPSGAVWSTTIPTTQHFGDWRLLQFVLAAAGTVAVPIAFLLRRGVAEQAVNLADRLSATRAQDLALRPRRLTWMPGLAGLGCCIANAMSQVRLAAPCTDLGFTLAEGTSLLSMILAGGIASRLASRMLIDGIGAMRVLLAASALQMLALALHTPPGGLASLAFVSLVFGLAQGGILPAYPILVRDYLPVRAAGAASGAVSMATLFGMAFGGWLAGWIYDHSHSYFLAFLNGIASSLLNLLLIGVVFRRLRRVGRPGAWPLVE
ncbi:MAG: MFS transporter [Albidovulum sp.]|uniref:MFS transporter n=1 Tax=Albidovulum sp. TaxID=1872424 RepID=UPI00132A5CD2|nr:MFS transporter [Defluviimonas sp.]KAB2886424.1 MAG: MFS transporter [Defluviimonas sp.]